MMDMILDKRPLEADLAPLVSQITASQTRYLSNLAADLLVRTEVGGVPREIAPHVVINCFILAAVNLGIAAAFEDGREPSRQTFLGTCDEAFTEVLGAHRKFAGGVA